MQPSFVIAGDEMGFELMLKISIFVVNNERAVHVIYHKNSNSEQNGGIFGKSYLQNLRF